MAANTIGDLEMLRQSVHDRFSEIAAALHMRQKLLLRQIDVIANSQKQQIGRTSVGNHVSSTSTDDVSDENKVKFLAEQEELLAAIRTFGRFQLGNMNLPLQDNYMKNEDYITPSNDHETMYKCLEQSSIAQTFQSSEHQPEVVLVDFSKNKSLIEHSTKNLNESIINITLQEAKELIRKAKQKREAPVPPLNLEELDDELESSIAEAVSSLGRESPVTNTKYSQTCVELASKKAKADRYQPKITINNCNGTINLRNISSLTINCAAEDAVSAELPTHEDAEEEKEPANVLSHSSQSTIKNKNQNSCMASKNQVVCVESTSTGYSTPSTSATSSSNYSSNSSSRSQSKKYKNKNKKITNKNAADTTTNTLAKMLPQASNATVQTNTYHPFEFVDDVDDGGGGGLNSDDHVIVDDDANDESNVATCDFYNRLLNEIKNSLKSKRTTVDNSRFLSGTKSTAADSTCDSNSNTCSNICKTTTTNSRRSTTTPPSSSSQQTAGCKRLILKNFENLKIILEANSDEESLHPVQIEQWLTEIISETDLEPMQNTDILEHSKIHKETA